MRFEPQPRFDPKPFRNLKTPLRCMTTVFAIESKDGIIMASDTQFTGRFREKGRKTWELRDNVLLGCAGYNNYNYLFWRRLRDEFDVEADITLPDRIDRGIKSFNAEMKDRIGILTHGEILERQPQGIVAGYDEGLDGGRYVMFEANPPEPCLEVDQRNMRVAAGTGGIAATVFLKTIESVMDDYGVFYSDLSWKIIAQLSWMMLNRITLIDPNTSGFGLWRIEKDDYHVLREADIFRKDTPPHYVSELLENVLKEIGSAKVWQILSDWKALDSTEKALSGGSS